MPILLNPGDRIYSFVHEQYVTVVELVDRRRVPRFTRGLPAGTRAILSYRVRLEDGTVSFVDDERIEVPAHVSRSSVQ
ncbi:hypothetical protein [Paraconexibacter sp. AEG42_29]|uniref:hypothetical protein n=1 Tax=Paraconexibacter sp. AEG42_29 TaxID=2997339 RepID=UPI00339D4C57